MWPVIRRLAKATAVTRSMTLSGREDDCDDDDYYDDDDYDDDNDDYDDYGNDRGDDQQHTYFSEYDGNHE